MYMRKKEKNSLCKCIKIDNSGIVGFNENR